MRGFSIGERFVATARDAQYLDAFDAIKDYIDAGDCYQVNLARHHRAAFTGDAATASWAAYQRLVEIQPAPFC